MKRRFVILVAVMAVATGIFAQTDKNNMILISGGSYKIYEDEYLYTSPVGSFAPNELGIYDICGNVYEWCWDWYSEYNENPVTKSYGSCHRTKKSLQECRICLPARTFVNPRLPQAANTLYASTMGNKEKA